MAQQAFYTKINAGAGVQFSGGTIAQATAVLHTNNVLYFRGGSAGLVLSNYDGSEGVVILNDHIKIETAGVERMRVTDDGSVIHKGPTGVGTNLQESWYYGTDSNYRLDLKQIVSSGLVKHSFNIVNNGVGYDNNLVLDRGNVGIGTSSPAALLDVTASSAPVFRMYRSGTGQVWTQEIDSSGRWQLREAASSGGTKYTRLQVDDPGNVTFSAYGSGSFTGTAAYNLQVDSSGNIIETAAGGSGTVTGSGTATYLPIWTGSSALGNSIVSSSGGDITINGSDNDPRIYINPLGGDIGDTALIQFNSRGIVGYTGGLIELGDNGQSKDVRLRVNTADIILQTSNTTRMTVKDTGLVGIGTASPATLLEVSSASSPNLRLRNTSGNHANSGTLEFREQDLGYGAFIKYNGDANFFQIGTRSSSTDYARMTILRDSGYIGVNITSPPQLLTISGDSNYIAHYDGSNYAFMLGADSSGDGNFELFNSSGTKVIKIYAETNATNYINNGGSVGIGTETPDEKLAVVGNVRANVSNGGGFMLTGSSASGLVRNNATGLALRTNTTDRLIIPASGYVGIGIASPVYELDVNGDIGTTRYIRHGGDSNTYFGFSGDDVIQFNVGGDEELYIKSAGSSANYPANIVYTDHNFQVGLDGGKHIGNRINYATSQGWVEDAAPTANQAGYYGGNFNLNGASTENQLGWGKNPWGARALIWTSINDSTSNADGGWGKNIAGLPGDDYAYMSIVYVKKNGTETTNTGSFYHGCSGSHTLNLDGNANTNPYFQSTSVNNLPDDVWCVSIGIIQANSDTNTTTGGLIGGIYRLDTGQKVQNATTFKMKSGSTAQTHRTYLYYSTNTNNNLSWYAPGFYVIDGTEPTLGELVNASSATNGSGTTNKISKWQDANTLTDSQLSDDGNNVTSAVPIIIQDSIAADNPALTIYNDTNGGGNNIFFSDQTGQSQKGYLSFFHSDGASQGGGATFQFHSTETDMTLQVGSSSKAARIVVWSNNNVNEVDYGFADDVNTGMTRTSADNVSLVAGGVRGVGVGATAVSLKYSGSTKIATTSTGVAVTGNMVTSGDVTINGSHLVLANGTTYATATDYLYIGGSGLDNADGAIYIGNKADGSGYGWRFIYKGSGSGNDNKLIIQSENAGSAVDALTFTQDGDATFSGALTTGDTLTIPSYLVHAGNTDTKMGFGNTDTIEFRTNATQRASINNSGFALDGGARVTTILDEDDMASDSATALSTQQSIKAYVDNSISGATLYKGTWDPSSGVYGSPDLSSASLQVNGQYYICSANGSATPNGAGTEPDSWHVGDWVIWNDDLGSSGLWQKIDNTSVISGAGTANKVVKWSDTETLADGPITFNGDNSTFAGNITMTNPLTIEGGSAQIILKDTSDDDDHSILFRSNVGGDDYKITTKDFTSAATGDGLFIGSEVAEPLGLITNDTLALTIDTGQGALFASDVAITAKLAVGATSVHGSYDLYNQGTFYSNGAATINANLTVDAGSISISGDGANFATLTESSSGDFTIAAVDDIRLDSGGNDIVLRGASSSEFGRLSNSSQDFIIRNITEDKDIKFDGNDGNGTSGTNITALRLDMSDAGWAHFNAGLTVGAGTSTFAGDVVLSSADPYLKIEAKNANSFVDPYLEFTTWNVASGASSGKISLTNGTFNSNDMAFFTETSNSVTEKMRILSTGQIKMNLYGSQTFSGTAAFNLSVDSNGNIIETSNATTGGPYLPLAAGSGYPLQGSLYFNSSVRSIVWPHTSGQTSSRSWAFIGEQGTYGKFELRRSDADDDTPDTTVLEFDLNGNATFAGETSQIYDPGNAGAFQYLKNANSGTSAYVSKKWQNDDAGFGEIWRNSSTRNAGAGNTVSSFNMYNSAAINFWPGGSLGLTLDASQNATFTGDITLDDNSGASPSLYLKNGNNNFWRLFCGSSEDLTFRLGTVTKLEIDSSGNADFAGTIASGNINISDGTPVLTLTDTSSSATATLTLDGVNLTLQNNGTDGDFTIKGKDGSSNINLLTFDTSEGGNATFAGAIDCGNITTYSRITFKYNGSGTGDNYIETGSDSLAFKNSGGGSTLVLDLAHLGATFHGNILTNTDSSSDIGTTSKRWANIWVDNINGGTPTTGGPYLPLAGGTMTGNLRINDSLNLYIGSGTDLVLAHNGTNSYISNYQGDLYIENSATSGDIKFKADNKAGGTMEYFRVDGGLTKVVASQPFIFEDNVQAQFGSSADLKIWHDGSHSFISDEGTGDLKITTSAGAVRIDKGVSENMAAFFPDGSVDLYYDNVRKFSTGATGITVQGNSNDITFVNDSSTDHNYLKVFVPDTTVNALGVSQTNVYIPLALEVDGIVTLNNNLQLQDSDSLQLGNSQDLELYHASGNSNIDNKTGHLYIRANVGSDTGSNIYIQAKSGENSIICNDDGSVNLYYNNSAKFYTHGSGVGAAGYYGFGTAGTSTGSSYYYRYGSVAAGATQGLVISTSDTGGSYFDGVAQFRNTNTGQGAGMFQMINFGALYGRYMNFYRGSTSNIIGYIGYNATNTAVTYSTSSSDIRLKKNIVTWDEKVLPKFLALTPKKFDFKAAVGDKGADKVKGFIAQYETENFPEVYQLNGNGQDARYGFHPMEMVPYLMKAVKELAEKNEDLERRLAALEK